MEDEDQFISFIHNYCDRWCERCEFTSRCRVFAMEAEMSDDEKDINNEAFVRNLSNIFAEAKQMLIEKAEEFGIDLSEESLEEAGVILENKRTATKASPLASMAQQYGFDIRPVLESKDEWLVGSDLGQDIIDEVLAVLYWYQFFIGAKVHRGVYGILDEDGNEQWDEIHDIESDANGSIKVALIAIERSILAWTYLLDASNAAVIRPLIERLETIRQATEKKFPVAREFVRPGFDEIEAVM
jgi:hypothetical protein